MKKPYMPSKVFNDGPLASAERRLESFSYNLYFSYIFDESVKQHQQLQDEYIEAFLDADEEKMKKLDMEMALVEGAFQITANMLDEREDVFS